MEREECYCDSDYGSDIDTRKSTSGCLLLYGSAPIIWKTQKQKLIATSTTEAEFISATLAVKELLWVRQLLVELGETVRATTIYIDNQGAIKIIQNSQLHAKSKHIDIKYMFIRDIVSKEIVISVYVQSENQLADILTKALPRDKFTKLIARINMRNLEVAVCALAILFTQVRDSESERNVYNKIASEANEGKLAAMNGDHVGPSSIVLALESPCDDLEAANEFSSDPSKERTVTKMEA